MSQTWPEFEGGWLAAVGMFCRADDALATLVSYLERRTLEIHSPVTVVVHELSGDLHGDVPMIRRFRMALAVGALFAMLVAASPVAAAGSGAAYGGCVADHARAEGGFSSEHNPGGLHFGFAGWTGTCSHA